MSVSRLFTLMLLTVVYLAGAVSPVWSQTVGSGLNAKRGWASQEVRRADNADYQEEQLLAG